MKGINVLPCLVFPPPPPPKTVEAGFAPVYTGAGVYMILIGRCLDKFTRGSDAWQSSFLKACQVLRRRDGLSLFSIPLRTPKQSGCPE